MSASKLWVYTCGSKHQPGEDQVNDSQPPELQEECLHQILITHTLLTFRTYAPRHLPHIKWRDKVIGEVWRKAGQDSLDCRINRTKWDWLGHTLRKPPAGAVQHTLWRNPQVKCRSGRRNIHETIHWSKRAADGLYMGTVTDILWQTEMVKPLMTNDPTGFELCLAVCRDINQLSTEPALNNHPKASSPEVYWCHGLSTLQLKRCRTNHLSEAWEALKPS